MATSLEVPDIVIAPIRNHRCSPWIAPEEIIANVLAALGFESLEISIRSAIHQVN